MLSASLSISAGGGRNKKRLPETGVLRKENKMKNNKKKNLDTTKELIIEYLENASEREKRLILAFVINIVKK